MHIVFVIFDFPYVLESQTLSRSGCLPRRNYSAVKKLQQGALPAEMHFLETMYVLRVPLLEFFFPLTTSPQSREKPKWKTSLLDSTLSGLKSKN